MALINFLPALYLIVHFFKPLPALHFIFKKKKKRDQLKEKWHSFVFQVVV